MPDKSGSRRLAAIVAADVVGYSRLMERDESGTLTSLTKHREDFIRPTVAEYHGRVVKLIGDGILIEFTSVVEAVNCAVAIQTGMASRNDGVPSHAVIRLRIGIHLGDIIIDGDDIYGDGVNVAARLEGLADPGGVYLSRQVYDQVENKLNVTIESVGQRRVKNISRPIHVYRVKLGARSRSELATDRAAAEQEIRYCTSRDGTALAYATVGHGPPLFQAPHFMTHLEHDWQSPTFGPFFREMAASYRFVRFDQRGNGLSERNPGEISFERFVQDFEAVANAAGVERFPIYGLSQGAAVAMTFAARHPERVSALVLHGGYARGRLKRGKPSQDDRAKVDALVTLIRTGWGQDNPAFRHMFTSMFIPGATVEQMDSFDEMMRIATAPDMAAEIFRENAEIDVSELANQVQAPTLVLHGRLDAVSPFDEGRRLAALIPDAKLVELDSPNHILLHDEPAMERLISEVRRFLAEHAA